MENYPIYCVDCETPNDNDAISCKNCGHTFDSTVLSEIKEWSRDSQVNDFLKKSCEYIDRNLLKNHHVNLFEKQERNVKMREQNSSAFTLGKYSVILGWFGLLIPLLAIAGFFCGVVGLSKAESKFERDECTKGIMVSVVCGVIGFVFGIVLLRIV